MVNWKILEGTQYKVKPNTHFVDSTNDVETFIITTPLDRYPDNPEKREEVKVTVTIKINEETKKPYAEVHFKHRLREDTWELGSTDAAGAITNYMAKIASLESFPLERWFEDFDEL